MKTSWLLILAAIMLGGCGPLRKDNGLKDADLEEARGKRDLYCQLANEKAKDAYGFVDHGDGALFTALHNVACGEKDFYKAEVSPGKWCRHPTCPGPKDGIATTFSRDMMLGVLVGLWHYQDKEAVARLIAHGRANGWDMCGPDGAVSEAERTARCNIRENLKATLYDMAAGLGVCDTECQVQRTVIPMVWDPRAVGYESHLLVVHTLLKGRIDGAINALQLDALRYQSERQPNNALYQATYHRFKDGDQSKALSLLASEDFFPDGDLPSTGQYNTHYLYQRDERVVRELSPDASGCIYFTDPSKTVVEECGHSSPQARQTYNKDWLPSSWHPKAPGEPFKFHAGTELVFTLYAAGL